MDARKIDLAAIIIIIILFVLAYVSIFKQGRDKVASLKLDETRLAEALRSAGDMNLELDRIASEIAHIQNNLEKFERQLPEEKRIHDFLVEIDALAKKNGIALQSIAPRKLETGVLYSRIPIAISANAEFRNFYTFLYQLENIPRITMTEGLSIKSQPDKTKYNIEMDLAVFVGGT